MKTQLTSNVDGLIINVSLIYIVERLNKDILLNNKDMLAKQQESDVIMVDSGTNPQFRQKPRQ